MMKMSALQDRYIGRSAAVLGGGPSLPEDFSRLPPGCVLIAVNHHAFHICQPDYMVYNDQPESDPLLQEAVKGPKHGTVLVSPDPTSDILFDVPVWTGFYSSNTAAWFALWLGCDPVILCGMDCYQGDKVYFHDYSHDVPTFHYPLEHHLRPWQEDGLNLLPHVERLCVMSGPLINIFGSFQGSEVV